MCLIDIFNCAVKDVTVVFQVTGVKMSISLVIKFKSSVEYRH
jgi:hypothetical protein